MNWSDYGIGGVWNSQRNENMQSGRLNLSRLDEETREEILAALKNGEDVRLVIWKNTKKGPNEKTPDFRIHAGMPESDGERNTSQQSQPEPATAEASNAGDVPF